MGPATRPVTGPAPGEVAAASTPGEVHLVAAGDFAATANTTAVLARTAALEPDLALALGHLSYGVTGAEQAWCDLVTSHVGAGFPFELLAGNHESNGQNGNINDFAACLPNQLPGVVGTYGRQYRVDVPAEDPLVRLVMISPALPYPDGTWSYAAGTPRYEWTAAAIDGARAAGVPWVVVGMHKPCLSLGQYSCEPGADLQALLLDRDVDLVLHGHEHLYQRTHQLGTGPGCTAVVPGQADPDCVVDADATMTRGAGTVFATVGTGGTVQRAVSTTDPELPYFAAAWGSAAPTWGVLDLRVTAETLTARFERASGGTGTDTFTLGPPDATPNTPPTASFTASCTGLDCTVDGGASADTDGTVTGWSWDFGDGATATGATATHRYATGGERTVTLVVTDDDGARGTTTRTLTPTAPPGSTALAADTFARTVTAGLGPAETGGTWRTTGVSTIWSVADGTGRVTLSRAGQGPEATLPEVTSARTDVTYTVAVDKPATGGGLTVTTVARRVGTADYRAGVRLRADGTVTLGLTRSAGTTETTLAPFAVVPGLTVTPGERLGIRVRATGTSPTTLAARVWRLGTPEPTTWGVTRTDATAGLQAAGATGVQTYLSSAATNAPVVVRLDDWLVTEPPA